MYKECRIFESPGDVSLRLDALGLKSTTLTDALEFAVRFARECTSHDPPGTSGYLMWAKSIRFLRDALVPEGWLSDNERNYPTVRSPQGTHAISVAGGDQATGVVSARPATRREKGPATRFAVDRNQLTFFSVDAAFAALEAPRRRQTWLLLYYEDRASNEIRCEMSLPWIMDDSGYVVEWQERVILEPLHVGRSAHGQMGDIAELPDPEVELRDTEDG